MTTAWQQLLEEAKELVSHTECEGCHLRPVCNVCYAAAHCEKQSPEAWTIFARWRKPKNGSLRIIPRNTLKTEDCETEYRPAND